MFLPIFGLLVLMFLQIGFLNNSQILMNQEISLPIPYWFNLPLKALSSLRSFIHVTDCQEWYYYQFTENATDRDISYFGSNEGLPMTNPESSGMLTGGQGFLETACPDIDRSVPYFIPNEKSGQSAN
mmetsp:Transcript_15182/g.23439  ORF Transcript_15182/g.23439 Transcript_15182/m.23439 type:complete len:127 (-) Transcript_15182:736-1116(-)